MLVRVGGARDVMLLIRADATRVYGLAVGASLQQRTCILPINYRGNTISVIFHTEVLFIAECAS